MGAGILRAPCFLLSLSPRKRACQGLKDVVTINSTAGVVEWVDAGDSKSPGPRACASSSLASGTSSICDFPGAQTGRSGPSVFYAALFATPPCCRLLMFQDEARWGRTNDPRRRRLPGVFGRHPLFGERNFRTCLNISSCLTSKRKRRGQYDKARPHPRLPQFASL